MSALPAIAGVHFPQTIPNIPNASEPPPCGILVVDDDEMIRVLLGNHLRRKGPPVWLAGSGAEAVELYQLHQHEIAAVVLDVRMPGMDGPRTFAKLKEINPNLACYFMSGNWEPYTEVQLMNMGAIDLLVKPHLFESLDGIVENYLVAVNV